jgi:hypothetical protein
MDEDRGKEAQRRGYWTVVELAQMAGLSGARIRQLLLGGRELRGDKAGPVWTIPYREGLRWLEQRHRK